MSTLELENVVRRYPGFGGEVVRAVDGVSLSVAAGEVVALYGPSGSGKSTLLMLAAALLLADEGTIRFEGRSLESFSRDEVIDYQRQKIGFIYQSFHLMAGVPALENAAIKLLAEGMSLKQARRATVPWLEQVGLGHRLDHSPERLSVGERQRVAIARALVNEPRMILADEPTGSLDTNRGMQILSLLADLSREQRVAVLLVTHDPQATKIADRVFVLRDGLLTDERAHDPSEDVTGFAELTQG